MEDKIEMAKRHVREAEEHVRHQQEIIRELKRDNHDIRMALELLTTMEETLMSLRDHLRLELLDQQNDSQTK